jgi:acyl carrier protein
LDTATLLPAVLCAFQWVLEDACFDTEDNFFDHGGDSVAASQLMAQIARTTGIDRPESLLLDYPSPAALAAALETPPRLVAPLQASGTAPPLFAVAGASGYTFGLTRLAAALGGDQPTYLLISPTRTPSPTTRRLAAQLDYIAAMELFAPGKSCQLLGTGGAAQIAWSFASQLVGRGLVVNLLVTIEAHARGLREDEVPINAPILSLTAHDDATKLGWAPMTSAEAVGVRIPSTDGLLGAKTVEAVAAEICKYRPGRNRNDNRSGSSTTDDPDGHAVSARRSTPS